MLKLKAIYLSHFHSDHHNGVYSLISERRRILNEFNLENKKLFVCAPSNLFNYFKSIDEIYLPGLEENVFLSDIELIDNDWLNMSYEIVKKENVLLIRNLIQRMKNELKIENLESVPVKHVAKSTGMVLDLNTEEKFRLVYSGDCSPTTELVKRGYNCDLLIHESTFDDNSCAKAEYLMHSTYSQAFTTGVRMNAKNICLTHFNMNLSTNTEHLFKNKEVIIAHDNMVLNRNTIDKAKRLNNSLKFLNPESHFYIRRNFK